MPRKVIKESELNCVFSENVSLDMIYAGWVSEEGHIFIINRIHQQNGMDFRTNWLFCDEMTTCYESVNLSDLIEELMGNGYEVFEFQDELELAKWIIKTGE